MRALSLPVTIRLVTVTLLAVVGLLGCGGGDDNGPNPPAEGRTGLKLLGLDFNCDFINDPIGIIKSNYTVGSTTTTVCIDGFIESNVPIAWSNSAGGSGTDLPDKVNCQCGNGCCQLVWGIGWGVGGIPLKTGINTFVFTATDGSGSNTASVTITRQP